MTREEISEKIFELERRNAESVMKSKMEEAKQKSREDAINFATKVVTEQMRANTLALFHRAIAGK